MSDLSWLNSHTPCNRCVRFATTVASGHATLATKRTLLLTWAGLPPAGSRQLCLAHSLDHLVGDGQQLCWYLETERFGRPSIDHELEFDRLLDGQIGRFLALQNPTGIEPDPPIHFDRARTIAHESSGLSIQAGVRARRDSMTRGQDHEMNAAREEERITGDEDSIDSRLNEGDERGVDLALGAGVADEQS